MSDDSANPPQSLGPVETTEESALVTSSESERVDEGKRTERGDLELKKLTLEVADLTFKQSWLAKCIAFLQGILPLAALVTLIWTISAGLRQQRLQSQDAENARFEHAYTKLGSQLPSERATGVTQASALLRVNGGVRDKEVLTALTNQLALDEDPAVRSAILNVFFYLDDRTGKDALDAALKSVVDLESVIVQSSGLTPFELATAQQDNRGIFFLPGELDSPRTNSIDPNWRQLVLVRLSSLKTAMLSLLKAGGRTANMARIFCPQCDFKSLDVDFSDVDFTNAILPRSQWEGLRLNHANFHDAVIEEANFTGAHLHGANFSEDQYNTNRQQYVEANILRNINPALPVALYLYEFSSGTPNFRCADLSDTSFENYPLLVRLDEIPPKPTGNGARPATERDSWPMVLHGADIARADFEQARELILVPFDPKKLKKATYAYLHQVQTPPGTKYHYYVEDVPLAYLRYYSRGTNPTADRDESRNVEAAGLSFVDTQNYAQAKLPPGVLAVIQDEAPNRKFRLAGCSSR